MRKSSVAALAVLGALLVSSFGPVLAASSSSTIIIGTTGAVTPKTFNVMQSTQTYYVSSIWQGLVGWSSNGTAIPQLADWWKISPDGLTYTFNLRNGLKWSDGQPLTSADVLFSVNATATQSSFWAVGIYGPLLVANAAYPSGEALASGAVTAPNSTEVVFHLSQVSAPFFLNAGGWEIIPQHIYAGFDWNTQNPDMTKVVGSGAFIPASFTSGVQLTEAANQYYYLGAPKLSQEILQFFSDSPSAELALESGQINVLQDVPPTDAGALSKVPGISLATQEDQSMVYFIFNMGSKLDDNSTNPVANVMVRQAIAEATNMNSILNSSLGAGHYILANQIEVPNMLYLGLSTQNSSIPTPAYAFNATAAGLLLDKAGYPLVSGHRFTINMISPTNGFGSAGTGASLKILQLFQSELAAVGITLNLVLLDPGTFSSQMFNGQPLTWSISVQTISESPDGDVGPFYIVGGIGGNAGAGGWNSGGYNNTVVNGLLKQEQTTTDAAARAAILRQIDSIAYQQLPVLPVYYNIELIAYDSNYQGFHFGLGDPEYDYWGDLKPSSISQVSFVGSGSTTSTTSIMSTTSSSTSIGSTTSTTSITSTPPTTSSSTSSSSSYTLIALIGTIAAVAIVSGVVAIGIAKSHRHHTFPDSMPSA
ncbi:MAG: ABC transporter substrate-binding protein [Thaumarchaeota archaeon]|nr:ABC transporter substrate-binding protein [Nitrososphaerota archaeon]